MSEDATGMPDTATDIVEVDGNSEADLPEAKVDATCKELSQGVRGGTEQLLSWDRFKRPGENKVRYLRVTVGENGEEPKVETVVYYLSDPFCYACDPELDPDASRVCELHEPIEFYFGE